MTYRERAVFQRAMDVCSLKLLSGWTVRLFKRGAAAQSPVLILAPGIASADPMECARLVPVETSVYRALAEAPETGGAAYVCGGLCIARDMLERLRMAGATEVEAVV